MSILASFILYMENFIPPENGESFHDIYKRSSQFIKEKLLPLENTKKNVLIVAHGAINRSIINQIMGIPIENFWKVNLQNCSVTQIDCKNGILSVIDESKIFY